MYVHDCVHTLILILRPVSSFHEMREERRDRVSASANEVGVVSSTSVDSLTELE